MANFDFKLEFDMDNSLQWLYVTPILIETLTFLIEKIKYERPKNGTFGGNG